MNSSLKGKRIILGVTASVAAYKACELSRSLKRLGAEIKVVMTRNATELVRPLLFETLLGGEVFVESFPKSRRNPMEHISLADWGDILLVAPATANFIGKATSGIADDLLSTTFLTFDKPVLVAPAMNSRMWRNEAVRDNIEVLRKRGVRFVGAAAGELACGSSGEGRLEELDKIITELEKILSLEKSLEGLKVLVSAGPTREYIDDVRFISNPSTGKMGFALAEAANNAGAIVTLVYGPTELQLPDGVVAVPVISAEDMAREILARIEDNDILYMSAAVGDWSPKRKSGKLKKSGLEKLNIELFPTTDILCELGKNKGSRLHIGFAVEVENEVENAKKKLSLKNLDMIFVNNPNRAGAAFGHSTNAGFLITRRDISEVPLCDKYKLAEIIIEKTVEILAEKRRNEAI